jgi:N-acetylmuramoyl-L-alanine amidase
MSWRQGISRVCLAVLAAMRMWMVSATSIGVLVLAACSAAAAPKALVSTTTSSALATATSSAAATHATTSPAARKVAPTATYLPSPSYRPTGAPPPVVGPVPHGTTIVLNPGHNGGNAGNAAAINRLVPAGFGQYKACDTTGTETNAGYSEHAFNWDVSLRVQAILQAHGVTVIMTRSSDSGVGPCVDERARIGNQGGVAGVVSIHADGAASSGHGFHVCEDSRQPAGPAVAAASHRLTVAMHDALLSGSGMTTSTYLGSNGYYPRSDLAGLNLATVPATFLEIGNMRNASDAAIQTSAAGRQRIAAALASGILSWLGHR